MRSFLRLGKEITQGLKDFWNFKIFGILIFIGKGEVKDEEVWEVIERIGKVGNRVYREEGCKVSEFEKGRVFLQGIMILIWF